jgi:hypothetical protein
MNAVVRPELAAEAWTPCSKHQMVLAFLQAEWEKYPQLHQLGDRRLITQGHADLGDFVQNSLRASLLWQVRGFLFQHVPHDIEWHEVSHLRCEHFWQLLNVHHFDWSRYAATNRLEEVAQVRGEPLRGAPDEWPPPILFGHDRDGPFTILEGNHRLSALASAPAERQNWRTIALVGLTPRRCGWHRPDGVW